jgi:hypothetical protein
MAPSWEDAEKQAAHECLCGTGALVVINTVYILVIVAPLASRYAS